MRRRIVTAAIAVIVVGSAASAALLLAGEGTSSPQATATASLSTAPVTRGDLVDTKTVAGTLGFADARALTAAAQGTLTEMAVGGTTIERGQTLYAIDRRPVTLMLGPVPLYRPLKVGIDNGPDVKQLEENLAALGYSGITVDERYTAATAAVVSRWQADRGLPQTGAVDAGQVLFLPGPVRVAQALLRVGDAAGPQKEVLSVTATSRVITVSLPLADQALAPVGAAVTVILPDRSSAPGKVTRVGAVAAAGTDTPTVPVEIGLDDPAKATGPDQTPVTVRLASAKRVDVLSVPVDALLALRDGGYGVQIAENGGIRTVPVQIGLLASARVEVEGPDLREGMQVVVPR